MNPGDLSETRREYILVGSAPASLLAMVSERSPGLIFNAIFLELFRL